MKKYRRHLAEETLGVGLLLATVGGFLDAYSYLLKGGVFANAQTGNIVLLGIHFAQREFIQCLYCLAPIFAFFFGVILTEIMKRNISNRAFFRWTHIVLLGEIILLFIIGLMPKNFPYSPVNITISFICAVQVCAFRKVVDSPYATTMCTGNLRSGTEELCRFLFEKDKKAAQKAACYFLIILFFCLGATLGIFFVRLWAEASIWVCCALLLFVLGLMQYKDRQR